MQNGFVKLNENLSKKAPFTDNVVDYAKALDNENAMYKQWEAIPNQIKLNYKWQVGDKTSLGKITEEFNLPNGEKQFLVNGNYYHEKALTPPLRSFSYYKGLANKKLTPQEVNQAKFFLKEVIYKDNKSPNFRKIQDEILKYKSIGYVFKIGYLQKNIKDNIFYSQVQETLKNDDKALNAFYDRFKAMRNKEV